MYTNADHVVPWGVFACDRECVHNQLFGDIKLSFPFDWGGFHPFSNDEMSACRISYQLNNRLIFAIVYLMKFLGKNTKVSLSYTCYNIFVKANEIRYVKQNKEN